jgi:drug/metabolite transporter (DMT)-like permease
VSGGVVTGVAAALAGAVCYGAAPVVQGVAARREADGVGVGGRLVLRLIRRPVWLAGIAVDLGGFVFEACAFSAAPATLVAPLMAFDTIVFVLIGTSVFHDRLSPRGVAGICVISVGIAALAAAFSGDDSLGATATDVELFAFLAASVGVCALAAVLGGRAVAAGRSVVAAGTFAAAAGIAFGLATMSTRQVGRTFHLDRPWLLLETPTPYVLAVSAVLALMCMQRGLQTSPLLTVPVVSALGAMLPVGLAAGVLGDPVPHGARLAGFVAALLLICGGVALLGRDRVSAEQHA